jgi:adenosylmethionine-8-amino-7-oxononanoate aminotransferase
MAEKRGANFPRSFRKQYDVAARGEGAFLFEQTGKRYLDLAGSAAVNLIGHGVPEIAQAMAEQARQLEFVHSSQFTTPIAEEFAREVLEFAGPAFADGAVYFTSGGSESVETALKLARQYQIEIGQAGRHKILSRRQAYHGATLGALAVSGNKRRREIYLPMVHDSEKVTIPYCYRCPYGCQECAPKHAAEVETALTKTGGQTAAFLFEPVSGATLGAVAPPKGYLEKVSEICAKHGVLAIADEVMTGFGRTGRNFAVEHWHVKPDIIVAAKGIASGYAPLGAVIASRKVVDAIAGGSGAFIHGLTYNAHPVALAAGKAVMRRMKRDNLVAAAATKGKVFGIELQRLQRSECVGDVRGIGLLWGVEFVADRASKQPFPVEKRFAERVGVAARKRGVLVYPMQGCVDGEQGDHLLLAPPAVASEADLRDAVAKLAEAIEEVSKEK